MSHVTDALRRAAFNEGEGRETIQSIGGQPIALIITLIIAGALSFALRAGRRGESIVHRPYNNRYNDASGAREETLD